jgi:hypothetical protein
VDHCFISLKDLAELEHYENLKEAHLRRSLMHVKEVLPMLKRCTQLRRLTLASEKRRPFPSSEELRDFIMEMKHLTFLQFVCLGNYYCDHFKAEVDGVRDLVLPHRPNFKFYISCCSEFVER